MTCSPNILFILADQFRADALGAVGGYARTPCLDSLAAEGAFFTNAFANSVACVPSRFSLATHLYPHQTGVWRNGRVTLNPATPTWTKAIENAGYHTALFGKTHLHPHIGDLRDRAHILHAIGLQVVDETAGPRASVKVLSNMTEGWARRGVWDAYRADLRQRLATKHFVARPSPLGLDDYYDVYVGRRAREFIESYDRAGPWFCWVSFGGPHEPWDAPEPYASMYDPALMPPPHSRIASAGPPIGALARVFASAQNSPPMSAEEVQALRANYAGSVTLLDDQIAALIKAIKTRGEYDRTLVVFASDHGEMNGDHGLIYKGNFLDPSLKVPLIIKPPRSNAESSPSLTAAPRRQIVALMDASATVLEYAGVAPVGHGKSLARIVENPDNVHRAIVVSEFRGHSAVVSESWKAEFAEGGDLAMLIDRTNDPDESTNLAGTSMTEAIARDLHDQLLAFRAETPVPTVNVTL